MHEWCQILLGLPSKYNVLLPRYNGAHTFFPSRKSCHRHPVTGNRRYFAMYLPHAQNCRI